MRPPAYPAPATALARIAVVVLVICLAACASRGRAPIEERSPRAVPPAGAPAPPARAPAGEPEGRAQTYTVKRGDTLYAIALDHGLDYRELAAWNNIENVNVIRVGQVLRVVPPGDSAPAPAAGVQTMPLRTAPPVQPGDATSAPASVTQAAPAVPPPPAAGARNTETYKTQPKAIKEPYSEQAVRDVQRAAAAPMVTPAPPAPSAPETVPPPVTAPPHATVPAEPKAVPKPANGAVDENDKVDWSWPVKGRLIAGFSDATNLKGIDIAGVAGQPVAAAGSGKVVYAGTGLRGYGKLIIVKHNDTYLSAYAHNREILVSEGQPVAKGQKIAEMGNTDADQVKLHFEIRRHGKPVDPLRYLPPA